VIYAGDACLKAAARNEAEEAAIAEIARKKDEAFQKKYTNRVGITYRQAARWGVKWVANIKKRQRQFIGMLVDEFMPAQKRWQQRRKSRLDIKY
jgi:hypothetical protein